MELGRLQRSEETDFLGKLPCVRFVAISDQLPNHELDRDIAQHTRHKDCDKIRRRRLCGIMTGCFLLIDVSRQFGKTDQLLLLQGGSQGQHGRLVAARSRQIILPVVILRRVQIREDQFSGYHGTIVYMIITDLTESLRSRLGSAAAHQPSGRFPLHRDHTGVESQRV